MNEQQNEQPQDQPEKKKHARKTRSRSKGEGSIFRRTGEGRKKPWVAQITQHGKLKTLGYFKTEGEAIIARNKALREIEQGTWVDASKQTMGEYMNYWLEHVHKPTIGPTTYAHYRYALDGRIIPALGLISVQKLTVRHLQMFYSDSLNNQGLSASYVRYLHGIIHVALEHAVREGLLARNISQGVKLPRSEKRERQVLSIDQAEHLWSSVEDQEMKTILILAVTTTLRRGEVLALKWRDIDVRKRQIQIRRNLVWIKGRGLIEKEPKTVHSQRTITLPHFAIEALEAHRTMQLQLRQQIGGFRQDLDLVFCKKDGNHIPLVTLDKRFARLLIALGLPKMRFHDLRHSAVTILLKMGVPAHVVQEIAGHSDVRITLGVYGHVLPGQQEEAMQRWDDALTNRQGT